MRDRPEAHPERERAALTEGEGARPEEAAADAADPVAATAREGEGGGDVPPPAGPPGPGDLGSRSAYWVGAGILLSRITGLVRERVFGHFFGASGHADAFRAALRLPNVVQNLLGEGTLSASFIPVYAEFLEKGEEEKAGRFAGAALGILSVVASTFALIGVLTAPLLIPLFFWKFPVWKQDLTVTLVQILFPMTGVLVISAWALGVLNSHRRFFVSYVAPVVWSLAQIAAMVGLGAYLGWGLDRLVVGLAVGALAGGVLQLLVQLPFVVPLLSHFRLSVSRAVEGVGEAIRNFVPVVAARGVINLSGWVDLFLAGMLAEGALAVMGYAQTLYLLPISLFGMSVAASELPELSRHREHVREVLSKRVREALERVAYFLVPSMLGYLFLGDVVVAALYQTGRFGSAEVLVSGAVLGAYALGLLASSSSRVLSSAYYALRDTRTPAKIAFLRVAVSVVVGASLMFPLDRFGFAGLRLGAMGLALGASAGAWLEYVLLRRVLTRRLGDHAPDRGALLRMVLSAALATAVGVGIQVTLPSPVALDAIGVPGPVWLAAGTLLPFVGVYFLATWLLGVAEPLRDLVGR